MANKLTNTFSLLALVACDAQAPIDYRGEALLHTQGSVEIEADAAQGFDTSDLEPAIAFVVPKQGKLRIADVQAQGEFPNRFSLDIYEPPPPDTYINVVPRAGTGRVAIAYITAVRPDHPEYVPIVTITSGSTSGIACAAGQDCSGCPADGCIVTKGACSGHGAEERCFEETLRCPEIDSPHDQCEQIDSSGDPSVIGKPWSEFAGVSQNYVLLYFEDAQPATSLLAFRFGAPQGLAAGYHLFELRNRTGAELAAYEDCQVRAKELAAARYNETHGTSRTIDWLDSEDDADLFWDLVNDAMRELSCPPDEIAWTPVPDTEDRAISVRLGRDVAPAFGL